ncbi:MAG: TVP38/TMEM64 family protein [Spirochaetes bacterium]|jgi:uncharacterized membrane protein YdjX (TVP38/TMEM64 family)|nr:TVP38/TMEM64 family protein [Spirochaetota bacterium]
MRLPWKKIALAWAALAVLAVLRLSGAGELISFENLQANRGRLLAFVDAHYALSALAYVIVYVAAVALSMPGAAVLTLAGGFAFGAGAGTLLVNVGATAGAALVFLAARYLLGGWVQKRYGERLAAFNAEIERNGARYLLTLRLIPLFPFFLINLMAGLTTVRFTTFVWTTAAGIIPGSFVYAYAGSRLSVIDSPADIVSWKVLSALVLLGALALVPVAREKLRGLLNPRPGAPGQDG